MSELRRNDGPDDGDKPADKPESADHPIQRPGLEIRSADMNEKWPVDRPKTTRAQRDFVRTGFGADSPRAEEPVDTFSMDWRKGWSLDKKKPPPDLKKPDFTAPPEDINRDNAALEARSIEHSDVADFEKFQPMETRRRRGRGIMDKMAEKSNDVLKVVHDSADAADHIFARPPTHTAVGSVPAPSEMPAPLHGTHSVGDTASALVAAAFAATMLSRKMHDTISGRKERHDGNG